MPEIIEMAEMSEITVIEITKMIEITEMTDVNDVPVSKCLWGTTRHRMQASEESILELSLVHILTLVD